MFDHKHYVPILKTKEGEMWSVLHLNDKWRSAITPLFEIHNHKAKKGQKPKPMVDHVADVCEKLRKCWGRNRPFFIDTEWLNGPHGACAANSTALNACRSLGLHAIPVVRIDYDGPTLDAVKSAIAIDKRGYLLRLDAEDAGAHPAIKGVVDHIGVSRSQVHLLLDYREQAMNLRIDVSKLPTIGEWSTFTAASAAFPKTISTLPSQQWIDIPRHDWNAWEHSVTSDHLPRKATFADYATRCCGKPAEGGDPYVHLRYTKGKKWLVYIDGTLQSGDAPNMPPICRKLALMPEFDGADFSFGDKTIERIGNQWDDTGAAREWLQWCLNHHLTFVANQILTHVAL